MRAFFLIITMFLSSPSIAADNTAVDAKTADQIRKALPMVPIAAIHTSPMPGLYELQVRNQIFYADANGRYLMRGGHILDMQEQKDLTQERLKELTGSGLTY